MIHWRGLKRNGSIAGRPTSKPSIRKLKKRKMLVICLVIRWVIELVQQTCRAWWCNKTRCTLVRTNRIEWRGWVVSKECKCTSISINSDHREVSHQTSMVNLVFPISNPILCHHSTRLTKDPNLKVKCSSVHNSHHQDIILVIIQEATRAARQVTHKACMVDKCSQVIIRATTSRVWAP